MLLERHFKLVVIAPPNIWEIQETDFKNKVKNGSSGVELRDMLTIYS